MSRWFDCFASRPSEVGTKWRAFCLLCFCVSAQPRGGEFMRWGRCRWPGGSGATRDTRKKEGGTWLSPRSLKLGLVFLLLSWYLFFGCFSSTKRKQNLPNMEKEMETIVLQELDVCLGWCWTSVLRGKFQCSTLIVWCTSFDPGRRCHFGSDSDLWTTTSSSLSTFF